MYRLRTIRIIHHINALKIKYQITFLILQERISNTWHISAFYYFVFFSSYTKLMFAYTNLSVQCKMSIKNTTRKDRNNMIFPQTPHEIIKKNVHFEHRNIITFNMCSLFWIVSFCCGFEDAFLCILMIGCILRSFCCTPNR